MQQQHTRAESLLDKGSEFAKVWFFPLFRWLGLAHTKKTNNPPPTAIAKLLWELASLLGPMVVIQLFQGAQKKGYCFCCTEIIFLELRSQKNVVDQKTHFPSPNFYCWSI